MQDVLYHTISADNFESCAESDSLQGRNTHRLHKNGTIPWNPVSREYRESVWYHGLCLSRDLKWAHQWKGSYSPKLVLAINRQKLKSRHKIIPYNWFESRVKSEFEEFVVLGNSGLTGADTLERHEHTHESRKRLVEGFLGELSNLHRYLHYATYYKGEKSNNPEYAEILLAQEILIKKYFSAHRIPLFISPPPLKEQQC